MSSLRYDMDDSLDGGIQQQPATSGRKSALNAAPGDELFNNMMGADFSIRKRRVWAPEEVSLASEDIDLLDDDDDLEEEEDDGVGCPLPSTPEDNQLLEAEMTEVLKAGVLSDEIDLGALAHNAAEQAEEFVRKVWEASWKVCHFKNLPAWLQDNDFLHKGHRPPLPSFSACFKSIFRIHTETGNIWTHLLGCVMFIGVAAYFLTRPSFEIQLQEKLIFLTFFIGAIICLGFSFAFHTLCCHSEMVGKLFSKLDYCGIALLIMGSFVPWLYYGFYCHYKHKLIYLTVVIVLGITSIITSLWDKFSQPNLRPLRAGVFMSFGLSGIIPAIHYVLMEGWISKISQASLGWLILMGLLYILGALFYALRVPERWFPGKCDIWFQSHQIFHVLVLVAAFVHYHGISEMAMYRVTVGECDIPHQHPAISF
ncbi:adiponectin receptor protein [Anopheles stephensi]|uniref:Adiponectin receptor n=1 Tax=Anopheles stephensi TaxID=30069 RepID=A0A182Y8T3_ANOST|nr:adiponectin receptor protein [Anopheles stephensi]XP_035892243.1 adiponectin receptor protein [Anopheles stephensi]XP_035892245.1 adiponectin receptor protein [Anopheles stephensi]XP_035892246.1 adiponectin receptor protein [Anopheles stephensi]